MATILKTSEAATLLNVDVDTLRDFCAKHGLPHFRIGSRYRFNKDEVLAWLETYRIGGASLKRVLRLRGFVEPYVPGMGEPLEDGVIRDTHVVDIGSLYRFTMPLNFDAGTVGRSKGYCTWVSLVRECCETEMTEVEADKLLEVQAAAKVSA